MRGGINLLYCVVSKDELYHHGIIGQKWGVRRYQNEDGTLTEEGKKRYYTDGSLTKSGQKLLSKTYKKYAVQASKNIAKEEWNIRTRSRKKAEQEFQETEFDKEQKNKYGEKYYERPGYYSDKLEEFNKLYFKNYYSEVDNFFKNDENYNRSWALLNKYSMTDWDKLAQINAAQYQEYEKWLKEYVK